MNPKNTIQDFWDRINILGYDDCWIWKACIYLDGYGQFVIDGKKKRAHRFAWELINGPIKEGLYICHKCDNILCCNPNHLFEGTQQQNISDMKRKGRKPDQHGENSPSAKLNEEEVLAIRASKKQTKYLAEEYDVSKSCIRMIRLYKNWKDI